MKEGWLSDRDLFTDDATVFKIIAAHRARLPSTHFQLFTTPFTVKEVPEGQHHFNHIKLKVRYFDPRVRIGGETKPLSSVDREFREKLEPMKRQFEERKKGKFFQVVFQR